MKHKVHIVNLEIGLEEKIMCQSSLYQMTNKWTTYPWLWRKMATELFDKKRMFWAKFLMAMASTRCLFIKGISRNVCRGKTFYLQTKKSFLVWKCGVWAEYFALGNQVAGFYYYHFFAEQNQHRHASAFPIFFSRQSHTAG